MKRTLLLAVLGSLWTATTTSAIVVSLPASKDNTLYESTTGAVSNGAGDYVFNGITREGFKRRAVMAFDVAGVIPAGSTINGVTLRLHMSRGKENTPFVTTLHLALADWGEGTSDADGEEGQGIASTTNDATWIHRFYPGALWGAPGGDYVASASASTSVSIDGYYDWSSSAMIADVQDWLDSPGTAFGWVLIGDETDIRSSKRFASRTNPTIAQRPQLIVDFTPPGGGPIGACCLPSGCEILSPTDCANSGGAYQGDNTPCSPDPCIGTPVTVTLEPNKDNTLYQNATGAVSNGLGQYFYGGRTNQGALLRAVLAFDLSSIPSNATITSVSLTMVVSQSAGGTAAMSLHRALASWGEGTSDAAGDESVGAPSTTGDATWVHRFYPGTLWSTAGGDFDATASATMSVPGAATYVWSSSTMLSDVQGWFANSATNFGWVLRGAESGNNRKGINSRQFSDPAQRPKLEITYVVESTGACCFTNGTCDELTEAACAAANGTYHGDGTTCTPELCPLVLEPFVDALPIPPLATPTSGTIGGVAEYTIPIQQITQKLHRDLPPTTLWGYGGMYPGPTIVASVDQEVTVHWINDLRDNGVLRTEHYLPVDMCIHGPDVEGPTPRITTHLHGGHVTPANDGYPTNTILPGQQQTTVYPNHQVAGTLWYHDHALGITRLNVMMGMAGFYLLFDPTEAALNLPSGEYEIGLAIQDRSVHSDGTLEYPAMWMDHFYGDFPVVNGKIWPYLNVKQGKYRFRMLEGSNTRSYVLTLSNGAPFTVIGTEGGLLPAPVVKTSLTMTPGERFDVIIDFAAYPAGTEIILQNSAPQGWPANSGPTDIPNVMKFVVVGAPGHTGPIPSSLVAVPPIPEAEAIQHRDLVLSKMTDPCSGSVWMINGKHFADPIDEFPLLGSTEVWRFVNNSGVVHPMHLHLTMFQILDRQNFVMVGDSVVTVGDPILPEPWEAGWKDTAPVYPDQVLRVICRFEDYTGKFPYHCHVLEHEENDMMRQFEVVVDTTATAVTPVRSKAYLSQCYPNPFNPSTKIDFTVAKPGPVRLEIFDVRGRLVATLVDRSVGTELQSVVWNGRDRDGGQVSSGVYFYRLTMPDQRSLTRKLVLLK